MVVSSVDCVEPPVIRITLVRKSAADAAIDGSLHLCELEIEFRRLGCRLGLYHIGHSDVVFVTARIILLGGNGPALHQLFGALEILQSEVALGFCALEVGPGAFGLGLRTASGQSQTTDRPTSPLARP